MFAHLFSANVGNGFALAYVGDVGTGDQLDNIVAECSCILLFVKHAQDFGSSGIDTAYQFGNIRALISHTLHSAPSTIAHLSPGRLNVSFDSMDQGPDG